jgi:hypothetical protein
MDMPKYGPEAHAKKWDLVPSSAGRMLERCRAVSIASNNTIADPNRRVAAVCPAVTDS